MQHMLMHVTNSSGLHARPASEFVNTSVKFEAEMGIRNITTGSEWADAKSILSVLGLGVEQDHDVELTVEGPDEAEAVAAMQGLRHIWTVAPAELHAGSPA